jgi:hypothetical protein
MPGFSSTARHGSDDQLHLAVWLDAGVDRDQGDRRLSPGGWTPERQVLPVLADGDGGRFPLRFPHEGQELRANSAQEYGGEFAAEPLLDLL